MAKKIDAGLGQDFTEVYRQAEHPPDCGCGDEGVAMGDLTSEERWLLLTEALEALYETGWALKTFDTELHPETVSLDLRATFAKTGEQTGEEDEASDD